MNIVFLNDWAPNGGNYNGAEIDDLKADFEIGDAELEGTTILVASYTYEDYSGSAYVLFAKDGKLFEVHGSHCSCYGLEGQWEPEEADAAAIRHRITKGTWGEVEKIKSAILTALDAFEKESA